MFKFIPGQRWQSSTEPELGLGRILSATRDRVRVHFRAAGVVREYGVESAPLQRVVFHSGDQLRLDDGCLLVVEQAITRDGLDHYLTGRGEVSEESLDDALLFNRPEERILLGQIDPS